jgi:threonine/homoserine/homoserine lactone efflux protein
MILKAILQGVGLGLALAMSFGPSFFVLLQTSSKSGFRSGLALALGILLSDMLCVVLAYLGVAQFFNNPLNRTYIGLIGGTVLLTFGLFSIFQKKAPDSNQTNEHGIIEMKEVKIPKFIVKGFLLNLFNPFVIILWGSWVGLVSSNTEYTHIHIILFFCAALITVFATDVLKAYSANKIRRYLSPKIMQIFNFILGIILAVSGLILIYRVFA